MIHGIEFCMVSILLLSATFKYGRYSITVFFIHVRHCSKFWYRCIQLVQGVWHILGGTQQLFCVNLLILLCYPAMFCDKHGGKHKEDVKNSQ